MNAPWEGARPRALRGGAMILDLTLTLDRVCRGLRELRIAGTRSLPTMTRLHWEDEDELHRASVRTNLAAY